MRTLKFRAWHKAQKKMDEVTELCTWRHLVYVATEDLSWTFSEIELMQFTGLKDKHGKEIYEGDIVRHQDISWGTYEEVVKYEQGLWNYSRGIVSGSRCQKPHIHWEVIGNIYENAALLQPATQ